MILLHLFTHLISVNVFPGKPKAQRRRDIGFLSTDHYQNVDVGDVGFFLQRKSESHQSRYLYDNVDMLYNGLDVTLYSLDNVAVGGQRRICFGPENLVKSKLM